jgi:hypothetical protein
VSDQVGTAKGISRPEFDAELNEDLKTRLQFERTRYSGLIGLAKGYGRTDIANILTSVRDAVAAGLEAAERLTVPSAAKESN